MSDPGDRASPLVKALFHADTGNLDLGRGARNAAIVLFPLVVGFALGLAEPAVLVTIGALNLLLVEAPRPGRTRGTVLGVAATTNAAAFAAGTLVGAVPGWVELPLVAVGFFVALQGMRSAEWQSASFLAAVMFAFAVGVPPTIALGLVLRPGAVLLGGLWTLAVLSARPLLSARSPSPLRRPPRFAPVATDGTVGSATVHASVVAATATLGLLVARELGLPRDYWVTLTVLVALRSDLRGTLGIASARILGTVAGAAAAFGVTTVTSSPLVLFPVLAATTVLAFATRGVNYVLYAVGITLTVILLLNLVYSGGPALATARVVDTVLGGALALAAALAVTRAVPPRPARASAGR